MSLTIYLMQQKRELLNWNILRKKIQTELQRTKRFGRKNRKNKTKHKDKLGQHFKKSKFLQLKSLRRSEIEVEQYWWKYSREFAFLWHLWTSQVELAVKNLSANEGDIMRCRSNPWVRKIWRRTSQHTPVFLPGESHGQRSLAGHSPQHCTVRHD